MTSEWIDGGRVAPKPANDRTDEGRGAMSHGFLGPSEFVQGNLAPQRQAPPRPAIALLAAAVVAVLLVSLPAVVGADTFTPVARWEFDEGAGGTTSDGIGSLVGSLEGGASWLVGGARGSASALAFDGSTGYVDINQAPVLEPREITITVWVRGDPAAPPRPGDVILEKGAFGCGRASYGLYVSDDGIRFAWEAPEYGQSWRNLAASTALVDLWDGGWHLLAAAVPVGSSGGRLSIDGYPWGATGNGYWSSAWTTAFRYTGADPASLRVGGPVTAGCGGSFLGDVDDLRIYDTPYYFDSATEQLPPQTVSISVVPHEPVLVEDYVTVSAQIPAEARMVGVTFSLIDPATQTVMATQSATPIANGLLSADMWMPAVPGLYELKATATGPTTVTTSDSVPLLVSAAATTTTLAADPKSPYPLKPFSLVATVTSAHLIRHAAASGSVEFFEVTPGGEVSLGSASLHVAAVDTSTARLEITSGRVAGTYSIVARFNRPDSQWASSESVPYTLGVSTEPSYTNAWLGAGNLQTHNPITIEAGIGWWGSDWQADRWTGATMTFAEINGRGPGCVLAVSATNEHKCVIPSLPIGSYSYQASYSGNAYASGSTSAPVTFTVVPDTVEASGVGVSRSTFYPYRDGYYDTVSIRGTRAEPISVTITVYGPTGRKVAQKSIGRAGGAYTYPWNGRTSTGVLLPAGTYKVVQTLKDAYGTTSSYTSKVVLSSKRLYTYTTYLTKAASSYAVRTSSWIGWQFTLPSATVYKSLVFQAYAWSTAVPGVSIGAWDVRECSFSCEWSSSYVTSWAPVGNIKSWHSKGISPTYNRSGRYVRAFAATSAWWGGGGSVSQVRLKVVYAILK